MTTPNMSLVLPVDHASADVWDVVLDAVFNLIDAHDHTSGKGVQIPSAAIGVNADVSWAGFALTHAKGVAFTEQAAASVSSYSDLLYVDSTTHDLMFRNSTGTNVKITDGATLNVSIVGGIGGDYSTAGALESFDDATKRYLLQSEGTPRPWSGLATADIDLYEKAASIVQAVKLKSPGSLVAGYTLTMPTALPSVTTPLTVTSAGQIATQSGLYINAQKVTASGTVTRTAGVTKCDIIMIGGGGGGGGAATGVGQAFASGGSSGMYYVKRNVPVTSDYVCTIGAGGAGGAAGNNPGSAGGDTQVVVSGTTYKAGGGFGGNGAANTSSGTSLASLFSFIDQAGGPDLYFIASGEDAWWSGTRSKSGAGGSTPLGTGGRAMVGDATSGAISITGDGDGTGDNEVAGYGGGGGGAVSGDGGAAASGGKGRPGVIFIIEYM